MDPLLPTEMEGEMKERRKIQFSVPSTISTQLDPQQVEMIRRRRPTPATLFRVTDHPSPEEENPSYQLAVNENGVHRPKKVNTAVYQPPSLKAVQKMAEAHIQALATYVPLEGPAEGRERQGGSISFGSENSQVVSRCDLTEHVVPSKLTAEEADHTLQKEMPEEKERQTRKQDKEQEKATQANENEEREGE